MKTKSLIPVFVIALAACAPKNFEAMQYVGSDAVGSVGCSSFESKTWDAVNRYLIEQDSVPSAEELKEHLRAALKETKNADGSLTNQQLEVLAQDFNELFEILLNEIPAAERTTDAQSLLAVLSALELGDHTTASKVRLQSRVQSQFAKVQAHAASMGVQCHQPQEPVAGHPNGEETEWPTPTPTPSSSALPLPVYGIRLTFATAYQTCQALTEPAMSKYTSEIDAKAVVITGRHPSGGGNKREIASVSGLLRTHPYYKNVNNYGSQCLNARSYPMIYDYGGKPYATTDSKSNLNLFRNSGSGTSVLGIDCSGFVYSGLATAGLRLSPNKNMKASGVYGISAAMYVEPQKNGMSCLQKITLTPKADLKAGDIVAISGHVVMVDSVGSDPFGIDGSRNSSECAKLRSKNFDFVVIQSSPSKNAVGMNRYEAKDYLTENDKIREGLEKYAYYACLARVNNKTYTPSLGTLSVVRHKQTSECLGTRIQLAQESCAKSCPQLTQ